MPLLGIGTCGFEYLIRNFFGYFNEEMEEEERNVRVEDGGARAGLSLNKGEEIREEVGPLIEVGA